LGALRAPPFESSTVRSRGDAVARRASPRAWPWAALRGGARALPLRLVARGLLSFSLVSNPIVLLPLDTAAREWLTSVGVDCPDQGGRWPTAGELRETLAGLPGREVTFRDRPDGGWDADVADADPDGLGWTATVWVEPPPPDPTFHHPFSFGDGPSPPLVVLIAEALSRFCGPLALYDPDANRPVLIVPGADPLRVADELYG